MHACGLLIALILAGQDPAVVDDAVREQRMRQLKRAHLERSLVAAREVALQTQLEAAGYVVVGTAIPVGTIATAATLVLLRPSAPAIPREVSALGLAVTALGCASACVVSPFAICGGFSKIDEIEAANEEIEMRARRLRDFRAHEKKSAWSGEAVPKKTAKEEGREELE